MKNNLNFLPRMIIDSFKPKFMTEAKGGGTGKSEEDEKFSAGLKSNLLKDTGKLKVGQDAFAFPKLKKTSDQTEKTTGESGEDTTGNALAATNEKNSEKKTEKKKDLLGFTARNTLPKDNNKTSLLGMVSRSNKKKTEG